MVEKINMHGLSMNEPYQAKFKENGQLGSYHCPRCRVELAHNITLDGEPIVMLANRYYLKNGVARYTDKPRLNLNHEEREEEKKQLAAAAQQSEADYQKMSADGQRFIDDLKARGVLRPLSPKPKIHGKSVAWPKPLSQMSDAEFQLAKKELRSQAIRNGGAVAVVLHTEFVRIENLPILIECRCPGNRLTSHVKLCKLLLSCARGAV